MVYSTMAEALESYKKEHPQKAAQVESAIHRVLLQSFGLSLSGSRATVKEKEKAAKLLQSLSLPDYDRSQWDELVEKSLALTNLEQKKQRSPRFYLRQFIGFVCQGSQQANQDSVVSSQNILRRVKVEPFIDRSYLEAAKPKIIRQDPIILKFDVEWYRSDYQKQFPEQSWSELSQIIQAHLTRIQKEIDGAADYLSSREKGRLEKVTLQNWIIAIKQMLGWHYQQTRDLEQVSIFNLITIVNSNISYLDYAQANDYFFAKGKAEHEAKLVAKKDLDSLKDFLTGYGKSYSGGSKKRYAQVLINLAKYFYRDITDESEAVNYEDIAVIRKLRAFINNIPDSPNKVKVLHLKWEELLQVRAELKKRVDDEFNYYVNQRGKIVKRLRKGTGSAKDLQSFLTYCFVTVIPPVRIRSIAELEIGRTLKYGLFDESGFTPKEYMKNPLEAKYYYHFGVLDYKTGKSYGEFIAELPNKSFGDGTYFYDYLNKWIEGGYRRQFLKDGQEHNYLFVKTRSGKKYQMGDPTTAQSLSGQISDMNEKYTRVRVSPQAFRKIYRTYLKNIGASRDELASAAFFMQHSEQMAEKVYTVQTLTEKLNPILGLVTRVN